MKKSTITLVRISAVFAVSSVCIVAEHVYFRLIKDSSSTDNCSDFVGRVGTAASAARCGSDCLWNGQCRGFLYDPATNACKDVYRDNITYPECQAVGGDDFYIEVCDRFLVSGPFGVADSQLDESTNWCDIKKPSAENCQPPGPHRPTSAKYARLNSTGMLTGSWIAGFQDQQQHIEERLKPDSHAEVINVFDDTKGILPYYAYLGYRITRVVCIKAVSGETEGRARCSLYTHNSSDPLSKICKVDFLKPKTVTRVVMQARNEVMLNEDHYVTSFKFLHSDDCTAYEELMGDNGNPLILEGNNNNIDTVIRELPRRVKARCFRINPVSWVTSIAMRFDLMGCP